MQPADPSQPIPDTAAAQLAEGIRLVEAGLAIPALRFANRASELDPNDPDPVFLRAWILANTGRAPEAEALATEMRQLMRFRRLNFTEHAVELLNRRLRWGRELAEARERKEREKAAKAAAKKAAKRVAEQTAKPNEVASAKPPAPTRGPAPIEADPTQVGREPMPSLSVAIAAPSLDALRPHIESADNSPFALRDYRLRLVAQDIERVRGYDTLLALAEVRGVDHYEYQLRTVRRVLREFRGRVLLADEVGLGKTVEACLCLKEYLLRGLVRSVLVIVPAPLREQWRDELRGKFGIEATLLEGQDLRAGGSALTDAGVRIVALSTARLPAAVEILTQARFDLVIVDEAHRLKNRKTRSWQLVDTLRPRYLFLLSATPIENDLIEIYNVLTLLKPGLFSTEADFRHAFMSGKSRLPTDPARLRALLREVMVRNTRALVDAQLPPRFATTLRAAPTGAEADVYARVTAAVRDGIRQGTLTLARAGEVLRAVGSAPFAAVDAVARHLGAELATAARALTATDARTAKDLALLEVLAKRERDKVLVFVGARKSQDHVFELVRRAGHRAALFHGSMDAPSKAAAIAAFAADTDVLVASDSGGEGFNLQFARTIVNYDLPWNPMRIEQRIGRVHRIGQTRDVFVFNLVTVGTIEEEVLRVLDEKINMFELVVGEIDAILGRLGDDEQDFQDVVLELYARASDAPSARAAFDSLAAQLLAARDDYQRVKQLEDRVLGEELGA